MGNSSVYTYNWLSLQRYTIPGTQPVPAGKATIRFEFDYDGGGIGKGGTGALFADGKRVAQGRIEQTQGFAFSAPVVENYGIRAPHEFAGKINKVTIDLQEIKTADKDTVETGVKDASRRNALSD